MDDDERLLHQLELVMEQSEANERSLKSADDARERNGAYDRYARRARVAASRMSREELETLVAAQAAAVKRAQRAAEIQEARENAIGWWLAHESALAHVAQSAKIRALTMRSVEDGRLAREKRWASHDQVRELVLKRWAEQTWPSKAAFARTIAPDVRSIAKQLGIGFSPDNIERTIRNWVSDK